MLRQPTRSRFETQEDYEDSMRAYEDALDATEERNIERYYERD